MFANLLNNAVQHGAKDSPVSLEAQGGRDAIEVQVKNYGPAIPADAVQVIFNPLVQARAGAETAESRSTSLGLGLFIARHIVLGHGGTLEVESVRRADGTIFTARLPRRDFSSTASGAPDRTSRP